MPETLPLDGITVLDFTRVVAGPMLGQTLADLGATVIKVEREGQGDDLRLVGPPWFQGTPKAGVPSTYFMAVNRGKTSVTVNFDDAQDRAWLREMALKADILIENFRTGTLARHGLGYEELSTENPGLIYCSITGFGQTGPKANDSGYDYLAQAMSGMMHVTGHETGAAGEGPMRIGVPIVDILTGKDAAIAVLAALRARDKSGRGQHLDAALYDSALGAMANPASSALNGGGLIAPSGNIHPSAFPYGTFPTRDGDILIATFTDSGFAGICRAVARPEWLEDPRFKTSADRVAHRHILGPMLVAELHHHGRAYWIARFNAEKVSCGPINTVGEALDDPQTHARELVIETQHPTLGTIRSVRFPVKFGAGWGANLRPPPLLGEGNAALKPPRDEEGRV